MVEPSTHSFIGLFILQIRKHVLYVKGCARHREHRDTEDAIPALRKVTARDKNQTAGEMHAAWAVIDHVGTNPVRGSKEVS